MSRRRNNNPEDEDNGFAQWGGYMNAKKTKLNEQFKTVTAAQIEKQSNIFENVSIFVNGRTNPTAEELKNLMAAHGGTFHVYQMSSTTHIIASNLPNVKIKHLGTTPIVKPSWITDSISLGKLLDYKRYLLYTNQSVTQPQLNFPVVQKPDTKTASDPSFLEEFYNNSRLHLISTLGAEFKQLICQLRDNPDHKFPGLERLPKKPNPNQLPVIMHIDMDCFFVSVALRNHPELKNQPLAITHARNGQLSSSNVENRQKEFALYSDRLPEGAESRISQIEGNMSMSEIASCSYEARKCGVKNGMFLGTAIKLCPNLKTLPYDFDGYREVSNVLYRTIAEYTLDIEAVSCDEMYVNCSDILRRSGMTVLEWAKHIREEVSRVTGCPCSTGFGANRLQARLATRRAKPNGQFYLETSDVESYMAEIPLADLPGVGSATLAKLRSLGLNNCGDVQLVSIKTLQKELGNKVGETIWQQAKGIDNKPLNYYHERKSVSAEVNYGIRFKSNEEVFKFLESLSNEVYSRLKDVGMRARCLTLKLMIRAAEAPVETAKFLGHGVCDTVTKSTNTNPLINSSEVVFREVKSLYQKVNPVCQDLRGIGIQLTKLEKNKQVNKLLGKFLDSGTNKEIVKEKNIEGEKDGKSKRGRPKGSRNKSKTPLKTNKFFLAQDQERPKIDLSVLEELPKEMRDEIIKEYKLDVKVDEVKVEIIQNHSKNPFDKLTWEEIKPIIKNWVSSEEAPLQIDVEMLAEHFKSLAITRKIEVLQQAFNFLHRIFTDLSCHWHRAYASLVEAMQQGMVARYGAVLMVKKSFVCCQINDRG